MSNNREDIDENSEQGSFVDSNDEAEREYEAESDVEEVPPEGGPFQVKVKIEHDRYRMGTPEQEERHKEPSQAAELQRTPPVRIEPNRNDDLVRTEYKEKPLHDPVRFSFPVRIPHTKYSTVDDPLTSRPHQYSVPVRIPHSRYMDPDRTVPEQSAADGQLTRSPLGYGVPVRIPHSRYMDPDRTVPEQSAADGQLTRSPLGCSVPVRIPHDKYRDPDQTVQTVPEQSAADGQLTRSPLGYGVLVRIPHDKYRDPDQRVSEQSAANDQLTRRSLGYDLRGRYSTSDRIPSQQSPLGERPRKRRVRFSDSVSTEGRRHYTTEDFERIEPEGYPAPERHDRPNRELGDRNPLVEHPQPRSTVEQSQPSTTVEPSPLVYRLRSGRFLIRRVEEPQEPPARRTFVQNFCQTRIPRRFRNYRCLFLVVVVLIFALAGLLALIIHYGSNCIEWCSEMCMEGFFERERDI